MYLQTDAAQWGKCRGQKQHSHGWLADTGQQHTKVSFPFAKLAGLRANPPVRHTTHHRRMLTCTPTPTHIHYIHVHAQDLQQCTTPSWHSVDARVSLDATPGLQCVWWPHL